MRPSPRVIMAAVLLAGVVPAGCSSVHGVYLTPDYDRAHRTHTYRLHVRVAGLPPMAPRARLWALVAQRWINQHRDFIAKRISTDAAEAEEGTAGCVGDTEAVLRLEVAMKRRGQEVAARALAVMWPCDGGDRIWSAQADGSWALHDDQLKITTRRYARELGERVGPYVPAVFRLLRELLATLPRPKLIRDEDVMEKIDYSG